MDRPPVMMFGMSQKIHWVRDDDNIGQAGAEGERFVIARRPKADEAIQGRR
jgi:hypothetical protein